MARSHATVDVAQPGRAVITAVLQAAGHEPGANGGALIAALTNDSGSIRFRNVPGMGFGDHPEHLTRGVHDKTTVDADGTVRCPDAAEVVRANPEALEWAERSLTSAVKLALLILGAFGEAAIVTGSDRFANVNKNQDIGGLDAFDRWTGGYAQFKSVADLRAGWGQGKKLPGRHKVDNRSEGHYVMTRPDLEEPRPIFGVARNYHGTLFVAEDYRHARAAAAESLGAETGYTYKWTGVGAGGTGSLKECWKGTAKYKRAFGME